MLLNIKARIDAYLSLGRGNDKPNNPMEQSP
jgi:hypothetical protein